MAGRNYQKIIRGCDGNRSFDGSISRNQFIWKKSGGYNLEIKRRYPALITFG